MFKKLIACFEEDVKLVVLIEDLSMYLSFINSIDYTVTTVEQITQPTSCIIALKMKYNEYLKFMNRLHNNALNLKQRTFGLVDVLIKMEKESTAKQIFFIARIKNESYNETKFEKGD